jgi:2,3-bisphosphoglycerate-independent phosphoglycerate mutase
MSAREITNRLEHAIAKKIYQFLVVNFANADMVGHTGNLRATIHAIEMLDKCMRQLSEGMLAQGGNVLISADHGNAEAMFERETGEINKEHTNNPVPCILIGRSFVNPKESVPDLSTFTPRGVLSDVAPTILKVMGVKIPAEMTGHPLV